VARLDVNAATSLALVEVVAAVPACAAAGPAGCMHLGLIAFTPWNVSMRRGSVVHNATTLRPMMLLLATHFRRVPCTHGG